MCFVVLNSLLFSLCKSLYLGIPPPLRPCFFLLFVAFFTSTCLCARRGLLEAALFIPFGRLLLTIWERGFFSLMFILHVTSILQSRHDVRASCLQALRNADREFFFWRGWGVLYTEGVGIRSRTLRCRRG